MDDLDGKVALVTGASRGVGAATAVALARAGCDVACAARSTASAPQRTAGTLDETVAAVSATGRRGLAVPTNLAVDEQVEAMVDATVEQFGRLDILVNNAAITFIGDLDIPLHRYDLVMQVNLRAPMIAMRRAVPAMRSVGGGTVINVSSVAALFPHASLMAYGMSKIGLERLTVDAAAQLAVGRHRRELLPHRHPGGLRGLRGQHPRGGPLQLGAVRGGRRGDRVDGGPADLLLRSAREHVRPAPPGGHHGLPRARSHPRGTAGGTVRRPGGRLPSGLRRALSRRRKEADPVAKRTAAEEEAIAARTEGLVHEERLGRWMDELDLPGRGEPVTSHFISGGASNEIFEIQRGEFRAVLRRPPRVVPKGRNETMLREYRVLEALNGTDVPHPEAFAACSDPEVIGSAFYLMSLVDGWSPMNMDGWPAPFDTDLDARFGLGIELVDGIARLARVDWKARGLEGFGKPEGFHDRQVDRWLAHLDAVQFRELPGLDVASDWLRSHKPTHWEPGIIHGDYQFANVMFGHGAPARLAAMVDWEMSTVGDPLLDLGLGDERLDRPGRGPDQGVRGLRRACPAGPRCSTTTPR